MFRFLRLGFRFSTELKINTKEFNFAEVRAMCNILNIPYHQFNQQIDIYEDVKLLDENNKVIGVYKPDDAKKKVSQLKKDMVLFNGVSNPIICKALDYRRDIVTKFYTDLVLKKKQAMVKASQLMKSIKLNPNLTDSELKIKATQIIQLSKKNLQVRIFAQSRRVQDQEKVKTKMQSLRNLIHNRVKINKEVREANKDQDSEAVTAFAQQDSQDEEKFFSGADRRRKIWEMVVESSKGQFQSKFEKSLKEHPEDSIRKFLQGYENQEDQDMKHLKYTIRKAKYDTRDTPLGQQVNAKTQTREDYIRKLQESVHDIKKKQYQLHLDLKLRSRLNQLGVKIDNQPHIASIASDEQSRA